MRQFQVPLIACAVALRSMAMAADAGGEAPARSSAVPGSPLWAVSLDLLPATRDRPLFSPSRRPPPPPPVSGRIETVAAIPAPSRPPSVVLLGIVADPDGTWALVRAGGSDKIMHARLGDDIAGWKVSEIESRRLVLSSDDRSVSFALFSRAGAKSSADGTPVARASDTRVQNVAQGRIDRRSGR
jgi:hypothetical protein